MNQGTQSLLLFNNWHNLKKLAQLFGAYLCFCPQLNVLPRRTTETNCCRLSSLLIIFNVLFQKSVHHAPGEEQVWQRQGLGFREQEQLVAEVQVSSSEIGATRKVQTRKVLLRKVQPLESQ